VSAPPILWEPSDERVERAWLTRYRRWLGDTRGLELERYDDLWRWSIADLEGFWESIWDFFGVGTVAARGHGPVLARREMPGAEWFPGARLNYAEYLLASADRHDPPERHDPPRLAIAHASELAPLEHWTRDDLREHTEALAAGMRALGIGIGDRVAAYLPNVPETVAAFLACASLGAIWSSCSPDFGPGAVIDRFGQIEPKLLLAVDGYRYGGRDFDRREVVAGLRERLPTLAHTILLPRLDSGGLPGALPWSELVATREPLRFERVPFDHPLWILYSSGTTGLPKAIVHGHGGILLEHLKMAYLHLDAHEDDRIFWATTSGWMMWNLLVGVLLSPASIVLYEGSPLIPRRDVLWDLAERAGISCFGTSASYVEACMKAGVEPRRGRELAPLTGVGSTGSPLGPAGFDWLYERLGPDLWLFSMSGGTDLCTAFVGGVPTLPVHGGELQARALGADVEAWSAEGRPLVGEVGELVIRQPMPSMPLRLWGDADGARERESYFSMYPGVWRHGDWIEINERGTAVIHGRSDSTINRGGVRMGTSEIYRVVLAEPEVVDALVVDLPRDGTRGWMPLFVVLRDGAALDDELATRLRRRLREECSPRYVPDEIMAVPDLPRTLSGKLLELPVKRILMGQAPEAAASLDALANPAALEWFASLAVSRSPEVA
jgi:acetoacetyl-CoA synthetase